MYVDAIQNTAVDIRFVKFDTYLVLTNTTYKNSQEQNNILPIFDFDFYLNYILF